MVKPKRKHIAAVVKSNSSQSALQNQLNVAVDLDSDLSGENSWVVIKKQRINIFVPPLPGIQQSTIPDLEQGHMQEDAPSNLTNTAPQLPSDNPHEACPAGINDGLVSLAQETNTQSDQKVYPPPDDNLVAIVRPTELGSGEPPNEGRIDALRTLHRKENGISKVDRNSTCHEPFRLFKDSRLAAGCNLLSATTLLNKRMRASNVERKIARAGGLSRWLSSLGLEQFVTIFSGKNVNKFQLVNLSMKKLKDMGAHAVGPRRKLIHAIECICEPYCLKGL